MSPDSDESARFAREGYVIVLEPITIPAGGWSVRVSVARGPEVLRSVDLSKELKFATRDAALAHGSQFVDALIRELRGP